MNNQQTELTIEQKLALLNGLSVVDFERHDDAEFSLYVANDETTLAVLRQVGLSESDIQSTLSFDPKVRDISIVGYQVGADYYHHGKGWQLYTVEDKLYMLNELEVVDADGDGETLFYAVVENNDKARETLEILGFDPKEHISDNDCIDISNVAWQCGATWYDGNKFLVEQPVVNYGGKPADTVFGA